MDFDKLFIVCYLVTDFFAKKKTKRSSRSITYAYKEIIPTAQRQDVRNRVKKDLLAIKHAFYIGNFEKK